MRTENNSALIPQLSVLGLTLCAMLFALGLAAEAQYMKKIPRIGVLSTGPAQFIDAFRQGLHELGYVEGENIVVENRDFEGKSNLLPELAAQLVRLKVDVLVAGGPNVARAFQQVTDIIPIVIAVSADPVESGLAASLARPGGNITGLSAMSPELSGKRLELLKEVVPKASRGAVIFNPENRGSLDRWKRTEFAGRSLGMKVRPLEVRRLEEIESAFKAATRERTQALIVLRDFFIEAHRKRIVDLAAESRLPAIYEQSDFVEAGGLLAYGPNNADLWRRAAIYVDKILKGAKPADLPIEQPTKFEAVINLKAAKQIGLTIPPNVLARAERVIK